MKLRTNHHLSAGVLVLLGLLLLSTQAHAETVEEEARRLFCCKEENAQCNSCRAGLSEKEYCERNIRLRQSPAMFAPKKVRGCGKYKEEYCKQNPDVCKKPCCRANNSECNSCNAGVSEENYCKNNQHVPGCEKFRNCCSAYDAKCNSCNAGVSEKEYCMKNSRVPGCDKYHKKPCCKANNSECNACNADMTEEEYCRHNPFVSGCEKFKKCCSAYDAKCNSCNAGVSEKEYCKKNSRVPGCDKYRDDGQGGVDFGGKKPCCKAKTAECLACSEGKSVKKFCKKRRNRDIPGCDSDRKDRGSFWDRWG